MDTFDEAKSRVEFRLTYNKTDPRTFYDGEMMGPSIPSAYGEGMSSGEWASGSIYPSDEADTETWMAHFASMAVNEAIHEALEWFKADGKPWLDPHGKHELVIYEATERLCEQLAAMRKEG